MKIYIQTHQYFNIMSYLTSDQSTIWADDKLCLSIIQKLIKGFLGAVKKKENLNEKALQTDFGKKRNKILSKINEQKKGFYCDFTETETKFLEYYFSFDDMKLNEISSQDIETEIVEMVNENFFNLITKI